MDWMFCGDCGGTSDARRENLYHARLCDIWIFHNIVDSHAVSRPGYARLTFVAGDGTHQFAAGGVCQDGDVSLSGKVYEQLWLHDEGLPTISDDVSYHLCAYVDYCGTE